MAIDGKYGRVTTEFGDIGEDEPVVVFRAQDGLLTGVLYAYRDMCSKAGSPQKHLAIIKDTIGRVRAWQEDPANYVRKPPTSEGPAGQSYDERHPRNQ